MSIIFSGKNGTVQYWYMYEHGPSPLPRAGSRVEMVCNDGLANMTESFFSHSFQLVSNVWLTPLHFLQLYRPPAASAAMRLVPSASLPEPWGMQFSWSTQHHAGASWAPAPAASQFSDGAYGRVCHRRHRWEMLLQLLYFGSSTNFRFNSPGHFHVSSCINITEK